MSLQKLLKDHQTKQAKLREENEHKRKAAISSVNAVTTALMDSVNLGVAHVFANQRRLEQETRNLQQQTQRFSKQTTQWLNLIESFNQSLKEIGDIENWAKTIENDMRVIATTVEYLQKQNDAVQP